MTLQEQSWVKIIMALAQISMTLGSIIAGFLVFLSGQLRAMLAETQEEERYRNEWFRPRYAMLQRASVYALAPLMANVLFAVIATSLRLICLEWIGIVSVGLLTCGIFVIMSAMFWFVAQEALLYGGRR